MTAPPHLCRRARSPREGTAGDPPKGGGGDFGKGARAVADVRLYLVPGGICDLHESVLMPERYQDRRLQVPIWSYLVRTPDSTVLIDTGMPPEAVRGPIFPGDRIIPVMTEDDVVTNRLRSTLGVEPGDIDLVVNSHLHFDHGGGNALFPDHTFTLQKAEYALVESGHYNQPYCQMQHVEPIEGDKELLPGLFAIFTPGHAPGHMSFLVRTRGEGPILLTIDASYTADTFSPDRLGAMADPAAGAESIRRLQAIAREENAKIFFGHDLQQGAEWRKAPEYYA